MDNLTIHFMHKVFCKSLNLLQYSVCFFNNSHVKTDKNDEIWLINMTKYINKTALENKFNIFISALREGYKYTGKIRIKAYFKIRLLFFCSLPRLHSFIAQLAAKREETEAGTGVRCSTCFAALYQYWGATNWIYVFVYGNHEGAVVLTENKKTFVFLLKTLKLPTERYKINLLANRRGDNNRTATFWPSRHHTTHDSTQQKQRTVMPSVKAVA